jgi:hypothetical protein
MFGFIASSLVSALIIINCAVLTIKDLADELESNARCVFLAQNPTFVKALLTERCRRSKSLILLSAFDDIGADRDDRSIKSHTSSSSFFHSLPQPSRVSKGISRRPADNTVTINVGQRLLQYFETGALE